MKTLLLPAFVAAIAAALLLDLAPAGEPPAWHQSALGPDGLTIDPTTTESYRARRIWQPEVPAAGIPTAPQRSRIVSYADKWTRHGLSTYMSWRLPNGPMAKRRQWQIPQDEQLKYARDYDVDGDGRTDDDFVAAHVFSLEQPLSNPRWPLHMAYPERFNEIFYGGAAWYLADTEPFSHRVWVEQGYNPDHSPPWFDNRAEDHPLQGQANEYEIGSGVRVYWAILWKKDDFLNGGDRCRVSFDDASRLAAITARTYWLGYDDVRLIVRDTGRLYISDTSQYEVPVRGYPLPANGRVFCVYPTRASWAEYEPKGHLIDFDPAAAVFEKREFHDVEAVGWYLAKSSLETGTQAHVKWYGFEADAVVHRPQSLAADRSAGSSPSFHLDMAAVPQTEDTPPFWMSTCEVPYALWKRIHRWGNAPFGTLQKRYVYDKFGDMGSMLFEPADSRRTFSPDEPATNVTLYDALAWCNTLSEYEGKTPCYYVDPRFEEIFKNQHLWTRARAQEPADGRKQNPLIEDTPVPTIYVRWDADGHRLPTPAEWQAAFQVGSTKTGADAATIAANSDRKTAAVGSRRPNDLGIHDMIGNVWELVWPYGDAFDPGKNNFAVAFGGDFLAPGDPTTAENAASPYGDAPFFGSGNIGLRLVCRDAGLTAPKRLPDSLGAPDENIPRWTIHKGRRTAARRKAEPSDSAVPEMVDVAGGLLADFAPDKSLPVDVTVSDFAIARYLTTYGCWKEVLQWAEANGYRFSHSGDMGSMYWYLFDHSPQEPVTHVTWHDMVVWCNALSEMEGRTPCFYEDPERTWVYRQAFKHRPVRMSGEEAVNLGGLEKYKGYMSGGTGTGEPWLFIRWDTDGYRLPTMAEYEYAARGGARSRAFWGSDDAGDYAWNIFNAGGRTHPVGLKEPNALGLYDVVGNVTHWLLSTGLSRSDPQRPLALDRNNPKMDRYYFYDLPQEYVLRAAGPTGAGASFLAEVSDDEISSEMYYPDVGFRVVRCAAGTHPLDGKEPLAEKRPAQARRLLPTSRTTGTIRLASQTAAAEGVTAPDIGTDACWRGNLRRTGEHDTLGVASLGGVLWEFDSGGKVRSGPLLFDGSVYVGSYGGHFHAIDAATGGQRWSVAVPGGVFSSACIADGIVYFGGNDGKLYAVDADDGRIVWTAQAKGVLSTSPAVAFGIVFVEPAIGLDAKTGRQVWGPPGARLSGSNYPIDSSVAIVDRLLVQNGGACDFDTARFAFGGGSWARQTTDAVAGGWIFTCQTGVGGGMYGDKGNGTLHAVELAGGEEKWSRITHREGTPQAWREVLMCSPAVHRGVVYIGSEHGELFALAARSGEQLWAFDAAGAIRSAPSISSGDGILYFGAGDGKIYALEAASGRKLWEFQTGDKVVSSPWPDSGRLYVGSDDGHVYALKGEGD